MITTRNLHPHDGGIQSIKDRAAHLVQALESCPLEFTLETLAVFDKCNSPDTTGRSARRWIREFCGLESKESNKKMESIIEVLDDGQVVTDRTKLKELMRDMPDVV
jgi:hypothetical protein